MVGNILENNMVTISGKIVSNAEFSHEVYGEGFYCFMLEVPRLSDSYDYIPVTVSERLVNKDELSIGKNIEVEGQFRSYNSFNNTQGNKLILTVFARDINFLEDDLKVKNPNQIYLNGYICKKPIFRVTPFGREITDILMAVNRPYNKSDYIPCIAWGRNARYSENLAVGTNIKIWGRIQSRAYQKKLDSGEVVTKTAYEVSISKMEVAAVRESEKKDYVEQDEENLVSKAKE
ncbi:single-stranded DNA-binding protein [Clostridium thermosuccinogenes]|uniref:Single-stranded DNA-binding protein n=1 Tax=Clostridium thermosuccinogenes TaxID=84032 RepID=A0A2K2FNS4_9CLOT|nr:single-stranded DNA-binding protein [Pseudoclostridium thermosuccinogenes]AUS95840.1 single-stranded DNA-binding protein [Pseudoclostridium thermosuccinogenes]PNT98335.1 single-stranded DNA-binding protein [Pseudoclostridium thermosuccinogenes]PNU00436.1 single-stranded DNA-binding protein [Pseudoclostridium thermosuccinogenes]